MDYDQCTNEKIGVLQYIRLSLYFTYIMDNNILNGLYKQREIAFTNKKRKLEYFGHVMPHEKYRILKFILQGNTDSKRRPGR